MGRRDTPRPAPGNKNGQARLGRPGHLLTHGAEGTRTPDPLVANQMLSQLSYSPERSRAEDPTGPPLLFLNVIDSGLRVN